MSKPASRAIAWMTSATWRRSGLLGTVRVTTGLGCPASRARALLREAGQPNPVVTLTVPNSPDLRQVAEVIQAMAREAGFDIRLQAMEFAASLTAAQRGDFEAYLLGWR